MRVTGGSLLNRRIECPPGIIRPAMDRMRESMFSILNSRGLITEAVFLDLCAGSGIMSIEASSRGAKEVTLVEKDYGKKRIIQKNLQLADEIGTRHTLFLKDVFKFLENYQGQPYTIIYADPPFPLNGKERILDLIDLNTNLLTPNGLFVVHIPSEEQKLWKEQSDSGLLKLIDTRVYGRSVLLFFKYFVI